MHKIKIEYNILCYVDLDLDIFLSTYNYNNTNTRVHEVKSKHIIKR